VATERAFIQVAVMLVAVMLDRRAITLRSVAMAALIVLAHRPETLFSPGFQMSFAATAALVAVFNAFRGAVWLKSRAGWQKWVFALVVSSVVAGLATAPFAAAHFNRIAVYGLAANLMTVPVMGSLIIPSAVVAAVLWPFGLSEIAFAVMEPGLIWTLEVAARVSDMPGAVDHVPSPPTPTLGLVTIGGLVLILWRGRARLAGCLPLVLAALLWTGVERPTLLVSDTGGLAGLMTPEGRTLSRPRGDGFVAGVWLENDGDGATQEAAAARQGWSTAGAGVSTEIDGLRVWHGAGRRALAEAAIACDTHDLIILSEPMEEAVPPLRGRQPDLALLERSAGGAHAAPGRAADCVVIDPTLLAMTGALAIAPGQGPGTYTIRTARGAQGARLWTSLR
jgi:competence protein ComEC